MKIGIIGIGMVGSAMLGTFGKLSSLEIVAYDKFRLGFTDEDVDFRSFETCDLIFVSVPTLTDEDGSQNLSPLVEVLERLKLVGYTGIVVNKCTVLPGVNQDLREQLGTRLVHYPEFLRAAKALHDFQHQHRIMLSSPVLAEALSVAEFLRAALGAIPFSVFKHYAVTEIAKYTHNCFLATKVSFLNEIANVCELYDVEYKQMISSLVSFGGVGSTHLDVPGPDGARGWGGFCFPKDTKAFSAFAQGINQPLEVLEAAIEVNNKYRGNE